MLKRGILVALLIVAFGSVAAAQYSNFFFNGSIDYPLPDSPCYAGTTVKSATPLIYQNAVWVFYTCSDQKTWARKFQPTAPPSTPVPPPQPPPPAPATITCPGSHPACVVLPPGTYDRAWADTIR